MFRTAAARVGKYLLVNDLHLTERPPSSCTDSYTDDLFALLQQTVLLAGSAQAEAVVWAGDVFHHKAPSRTSHRLVQRTIALMESYSCPLYIVPGNHDIQHDRLDSVMATQPLGVLFRAGARVLSGWAIDSSDGLPLYGVPWQQTWDDEHVSAALEAYRVLAPRTGHTLVVTHAPLYPPGLELPFEYYQAARFAELMGGYGSAHYGHVHERHGIYDVQGVTFSNPGALSRGSIHEHNLTRVPAVTIWDDVLGEFTEIQLNARPADQVFRLGDVKAAADVQMRLDDFLAGVSGTSLSVLSAEAVLAHVGTLGLPAGDVPLIEELLAHAATEKAGK